MLLRAWAQVRREGWHLVVCGPDDRGHRGTLERLAAQLGLTKQVSFKREADGREKAQLLAQSQLFILPSHSESFGLVVAEALAAAVPVVTTDQTPWTWLDAERCGWCVPVSTESLVGALQEATALPSSQLREMGERGRAIVSRSFSWDVVAERMVGVYRWALGDGPAPPAVVPRGQVPERAALHVTSL
jgi:glycosyltransferase involved in cell wall biosynthesis